VAIAGLVFGHDAAEGAIVGQLNRLIGDATTRALEEMIKSADDPADGIVAMILGIAALIAMNAIWKAKSEASTLSRLVRARLASLVLIVTCGFLLTVSLAVSAGLAALSKYQKVFFQALM
jgi:membrane protein